MTMKLTHWKLKYQLAIQIAVVILGFVATALVTQTMMANAIINGPVYHDIIQGKDLVADILPPPEYLVESWQNALEMLVTPISELEPLVKTSMRLENEYQSRHLFWDKSLADKTIRETMLSKAYQPGLEFLKICNESYIPALQAGDRANAEHALITMKAAYKKHRKAIDEVVVLANNQSSQLELNAASIIERSILISALVMLAVLVIVALFSWLILNSIIKKLGGEPSEIHSVADRISVGDVSVATPVKSGDKSSVMYAMGRMKQSFSDLIDDTHRLTTTVMSGDITTRVDTSKHRGAFGELLSSVNETLDSVVEPLNMTADYIDKIAKGNIPPKITGFGEEINTINTIRRNLNTTIETLTSFIAEMQSMSKQHEQGETDAVIDPNQFQGAYKAMAQGVNMMVAGHIADNKKTMDCVKQFGEGNFEAPLEPFPGKKAFINDMIEQVRDNLKALIEDAYWLAAQAQEGNLSARADADRHHGDFRKIIAGINHALDAIVIPIQETIAQITKYSRGEITEEFTSEYKGDFVELKKRLNYLSLTIKGVIDSCDYVRNEHEKGEIDIMIATERFKGDFGRMATNINTVLSSHIELNKKTMACVEEFGKGNFEAPLEQFLGKKAFINKTVEQVRSNLKALIADTDMLSQAALDGRIQVRADASKHYGDFSKIIEGINATLESIVNPIITVKSAVDSISTAAKEISAGNADLSHRTEQQAASLEETASSMEQLASTVKQNADNARQANQMAQTASEVAAKGGGLVKQVISTMSDINESANKIADIIGVIDGIALQTNILALNAAVEAARAGEQGRGFAVVASEVRNLAQRSAAAAKEIKALIGNSVEKVEDGSKLVGEAGKTMDEILTSVKRVTDIMTDIATASVEQSSGISQVNKAVSQMDEVTQQNAALVEQAAAAAESLEEQAGSLATTVALFHLDSDTGLSAAMHKKLPVTKSTPRILVTNPAKSHKAEDDEWVEF
jgi:methyl-accepting chemotaxis protein